MPLFVQTLSDVHSDWSSQPTDVMATLSRAAGMCCLSVCLAVYLTPLAPHTQLNVINTQLLPVMHERGVDLHFPEKDQLLSAFVMNDENPLENDSKELDKTPTTLNDEGNPQSSVDSSSTDSVLHVCSYSELAQAIVSTISPPSAMHRWLSECGSVSQCMGIGLLEGAWQRWPLVYDPQGLAREWVKATHGDTLISLDGDNRWARHYQYRIDDLSYIYVYRLRQIKLRMHYNYAIRVKN